ncbi:MAG TPA: aminoglycoside phosphotransferase family protein [Nocardioidaceae bacterium]|nr:aminoglycoside phosphotransferase family protein [Nocardioidaceae bacterium]
MAQIPVEIPRGLAARAALGSDWADWLDRLPQLVAALVEEWELRYDGPPRHGFASLVVPVQTPDRPAALKVTFDGDDESVHEGLALQHWGGRGAVQLLRADPHRRALLLERLHTEDLSGVWDIDACEIVAGAYARIHVPAVPQLRPLTSYLDSWNDGLANLPRDAPLPRRLVEHAVSLARSFSTDAASTGTLIHGDLHYANMLAADREPWLVVDPKPMSGDAHYEVAPLLWNRWEEMTHNVRDAIRRRFHTVVDTAGLDEDRARDWVVVRSLHNAFWTVDDARRLHEPIGAQGREWITRMIAVAKSVQG